MITFARLVSGLWCDPREAASLEELGSQYHPDWVAAQKASGCWFQEVDAATYSALTKTPNLTMSYATLSASGFQDVCEAGFGSGAAGATRFGNVIRAMETSADDMVFSLFQRFTKSVLFDRPKSGQFLSVLVSKGIVTGSERTAILNAWPQVAL